MYTMQRFYFVFYLEGKHFLTIILVFQILKRICSNLDDRLYFCTRKFAMIFFLFHTEAHLLLK